MDKKLILAAALAALFGSGANAATLCVQPDGNGNCESSIQAAVDAAAAGDTIKIKPGTYYEAVFVPSDKTGLIIKGSKQSIIDSDDKSYGLEIQADDVSVMNLAIHNSDDIGIYVNGGNNVLIRGVHIRNASSNCIDIEADGALIEKNRLQACGSDGIEVEGTDAIISNNQISQSSSDGIDLDGDDAVIEKNRITQVESDGIDANGNNLVITKNKITNVDNDGIQVDGHNSLITRNQIAHTGSQGITNTGEDPWDNSEVSRNRVSQTGSEGIIFSCDDCDKALLEANVVKFAFNDEDECFDIGADTDGLEVNKNLGLDCGGDGFDVNGEGAVLITSNRSLNAGFNGGNNGFDIKGQGKKTLIKNLARGSANNGFVISDGDSDPGFDAEHELENNRAIDNSADGFEIDLTADATTLLNNKAIRNIRNGISLFSDANTVTGNKASNNREGFDFCDEGSSNTLTDNKFGSETTSCTP